MSRLKLVISLPQFILLFLGAVITVFTICIVYITVFFQTTTDKQMLNELDYQTQNTSNTLDRIMEHIAVIGQYLVADTNIIASVNNPDSKTDINRIIISSKIHFDFDEAWLFGQDGEVLFQNGQDESFKTNQQFKSIIDDSMKNVIIRGQFVDSTIYNAPVFYLLFPVSGQDRKGLLVIGKVFSHDYLRSLFPQPDRGVLIFSQQMDVAVSSSNKDSLLFSQFIKTKTLQQILSTLSIDGEYIDTLITNEFAGMFRFKYIRYNTFVVGLVGYYISIEDFLSVRKAFIYSALIGLIVSSIITLIGYYTIHSLVIVPIITLREGFQKISKGILDFHLELKGVREMQSINSSFNETVDSLLMVYANLEKKVMERTKELHGKVEELKQTNKLMVGREIRMSELKAEIQALKDKLTRLEG